MKKESINDTDLFLAFCQIVEGCSEKVFLGNPVFIKHIALKEREFFNKKYKAYLAHAISKGLPKEEDALKKAIDEELWSEKEDDDIKVSERYIETLNITKKKVFKKLQIQEIEKTLKEEKEKIAKKLAEKKQILGKTAEDYASNRASDYLIYSCFYKDRELTKLLFSEEEFEEISTKELELLLAINLWPLLKNLNIKLSELSLKQSERIISLAFKLVPDASSNKPDAMKMIRWFIYLKVKSIFYYKDNQQYRKEQ